MYCFYQTNSITSTLSVSVFRKSINTCHLMTPRSGFVMLTCLLSFFLSNTSRSTNYESKISCAPPVQSSLVFVSTVLRAFFLAVLLLHTTLVACFASLVFNFSSEIEIRRGSFVLTPLRRSPRGELSEVLPSDPLLLSDTRAAVASDSDTLLGVWYPWNEANVFLQRGVARLQVPLLSDSVTWWEALTEPHNAQMFLSIFKLSWWPRCVHSKRWNCFFFSAWRSRRRSTPIKGSYEVTVFMLHHSS